MLEWWSWSWLAADRAYAQWLDAVPSSSHLTKCEVVCPRLFDPIEGRFFRKLLANMPNDLRQAITHEGVWGSMGQHS